MAEKGQGLFLGSTPIQTIKNGNFVLANPVEDVLFIEYLIVGAGGANRITSGGGGGGGQFISSSMLVYNNYDNNITEVGVGVSFENGTSTTFNGITAIGGGRGSLGGDFSLAGACGGGSGNSLTGSAGLAGFDGGGIDYNYAGESGGSGGGGGASEIGGQGEQQFFNPDTGGKGGDGGDGLQWLDGNYYCGGGGGGDYSLADASSVPGLGGGSAHYGGGGDSNENTAGSGNSPGSNGVVKIRYVGTPVATGGDITQSGGYTYHTFTTTGTFKYNR